MYTLIEMRLLLSFGLIEIVVVAPELVIRVIIDRIQA